MQTINKSIFENHALLAAILSWAIAQVSKTILELVKQRKLVVSRLVSSGGMPSSHSALVTALAAATGRQVGVASPIFAVTVVLASIVMYDAAGVRRAVSIQARILNQMIEEAFQGSPMAEKRLRELIGHTPIQVIAGGILGICVGLFINL